VPVTFLYFRPDIDDEPERQIELRGVLDRLATELRLHPDADLRPQGRTSITVPGVAPDDVWTALDGFLPLWKQAALFYLPRLHLLRGEG
jgi:hypothetical protein